MSLGDELTPARASVFDNHYRAGWVLLKSLMLVGSNADAKKSVTGRADQAVAHFRECLALAPSSWACMWGIGKALQAKGSHREALAWFERAAAIETGNHDVWREAAITACATGEARKAVEYATTALSLRPEDPGL